MSECCGVVLTRSSLMYLWRISLICSSNRSSSSFLWRPRLSSLSVLASSRSAENRLWTSLNFTSPLLSFSSRPFARWVRWSFSFEKQIQIMKRNVEGKWGETGRECTKVKGSGRGFDRNGKIANGNRTWNSQQLWLTLQHWSMRTGEVTNQFVSNTILEQKKGWFLPSPPFPFFSNFNLVFSILFCSFTSLTTTIS